MMTKRDLKDLRAILLMFEGKPIKNCVEILESALDYVKEGSYLDVLDFNEGTFGDATFSSSHLYYKKILEESINGERGEDNA